MKKILAVSGGVDSMVMLDLFKDDPEVVVAHFNHGTRPSADTDQAFVKREAISHAIPFYSEKANLGENSSEENSRKARYAFLNRLKIDLNGKIYTAHHLDDLMESIAINILRGTGWRGLTPLTLHAHPLLDKKWDKKDVLRYASENNIIFRQDPTNTSENYLRNRIRGKLIPGSEPGMKEKIFSLWMDQKNLRESIEQIDQAVFPKAQKTLDKTLFLTAQTEVSLELLDFALKANQISLTRPQLQDFLHAIKTYIPGKKFNLPKSKHATITRSSIILP